MTVRFSSKLSTKILSYLELFFLISLTLYLAHSNDIVTDDSERGISAEVDNIGLVGKILTVVFLVIICSTIFSVIYLLIH